MEYTEVKLIAVWSGPKAPPSQLKLSDYKLPVAGRMPKNYFNALYGNRNAYMALGELLAQAQKSGHYFSTATITVGIETPRKPGEVHLEDIGEYTGAQFVNLSRVSKEVVSEVADIYRTCSAFKNLPDDEVDWRKPFRFMPECPEHLPVVDRKSTRLNSSHDQSSYAVFCLKKKKKVHAKMHPCTRSLQRQ